MNKALLGKWCWHYSNPHYQNLWKSIILAKHSLGVKGKSSFWKAVELEFELINLEAQMHLGDGALTKFWYDVWVGEMSLSHMFPQLAALAINPGITVQAAWEVGDELRYQIRFKKSLTSQQQHEWMELQHHIAAFSLHQGTSDIMCWRLQHHGYSVQL
jgi:hypothetical protein